MKRGQVRNDSMVGCHVAFILVFFSLFRLQVSIRLRKTLGLKAIRSFVEPRDRDTGQETGLFQDISHRTLVQEPSGSAQRE